MHAGRRAAMALAVLLLALIPATPGSASGLFSPGIDVLSSRADQVSGGDALIRVRYFGPIQTVKVTVDGRDVTAQLTADGHTLQGVVTGLAVGENHVVARGAWGPAGRLTVRNFPLSGPIFAGPKQYPFLCRTEQNGLGQPTVDNQAGQGMRVRDSAGNVVGWSKDCAAPAVFDQVYRATNGQFKPMPTDGSRPADLTTTTTLDGRTVDYVVKRERGVIDRFIYSIAMLADEAAWNKRVIYRFDGGVGIGHDQGNLSSSGMLYHDGLKLGYAVIYSTGNRTSVHYDLIAGGENALMVKERFIEEHGVPLYTVGVGGSGGGLQQYVYGQNYGSRLIDAAIPQYSYSDMVTQTIHVGDCELLEYYMDITDRANPKWQDWDNRQLLIGMNGSNTVPNPYRANAPGSDECVAGWRGLTPLTLNPLWTQLDPLWAQMDPPGVAATVHWTHADDVVNTYGLGPDGYARNPWDNIGVQYGLSALTSGRITPEEFLDLNAKVGSWKPAAEMVQEGCPFTPSACANPAQLDPWSARNMNLGGPVAPRKPGDRVAIANVERSGLVFHGDIDIPVIDWRHYLEDQLNMHNTHQSFATRQRMLDRDRHAGNQVIWFTDARPAVAFDQTPMALSVMDEWLLNLRAHPWKGVVGNKPSGAVDRCFDTSGAEIAAGPHVWDGILDHDPAGACTAKFPIYGTSRTVAGGPIEGGVWACKLQPVDRAIARGLYGAWQPSAAQQDLLKQIFPTGVCDY